MADEVQGLPAQQTLPVSSPLSGEVVPHQEPVAAPQTQEEYYAQHGQQAQAAPPQTQQPPQAVPYDRFAEVAHQKRTLEAKLGAMEETINRLRSAIDPTSQAQETQADREAREREFYQDPRKYIDERIAELSEATQRAYPAAQEVMDYEMCKRGLRQLHGVNSEVENQVVDVIRQFGLKTVEGGRGQAIRAAYKMVTGHNLDDVGGTNGQRQVKQSLASPGHGSVQSEQVQAGDLASLYNMTPAQVEHMGAQNWVKRVEAAVQQQPT